MDAYSYLSRFSHDPIYSATSFFDLPIAFIEQSLKSMQRIEKNRTQVDSVSTAYLADTVLSIVHALYGKDGHQYKSNPAAFLPHQDREVVEEEQLLNPSPETIKILLKLIKTQQINGLIVAHLAEYLPTWVEHYD